MNKIYTVCVNNYFPEMTKFTLPTIEAYAKKIGFEFVLITERKYLDWPPTYEKLQIYELSKDNEWTMHIDADVMIHPDFWDVTKVVDPRGVGFWQAYDVREWFQPDEYFLRDGRLRGVTSNFVVTHKMCRDFWTPLEFTVDEARTKTKRMHGVDDYCFSRNLAKFGLKEFGVVVEENKDHLVHLCASGGDTDYKKEILDQAQKVKDLWKL